MSDNSKSSFHQNYKKSQKKIRKGWKDESSHDCRKLARAAQM